MSSPSISADTTAFDWRALRASVERGMLRDRAALVGRLRRLEELARNGRAPAAEVAKLQADVKGSEDRARERRNGLPKIDYPEELPISGRRDEIAKAIQANRVVIVCGETGSGKTTQLPKICLELGRGVQGFIGRARRAGVHRPHATPPDRRARGRVTTVRRVAHGTRHHRWFPGALHRPQQR
jgi:hypothetical protein